MNHSLNYVHNDCRQRISQFTTQFLHTYVMNHEREFSPRVFVIQSAQLSRLIPQSNFECCLSMPRYSNLKLCLRPSYITQSLNTGDLILRLCPLGVMPESMLSRSPVVLNMYAQVVIIARTFLRKFGVLTKYTKILKHQIQQTSNPRNFQSATFCIR